MKSVFGSLLFAISLSAAQPGNVSLSYGSNGLSAINYNGFQYLSYGIFGVNGVNFVNSAGQITPGSTSGTTVYDSVHQRTTITLNWGKVVVGYAASGSRMNVTIATTNTSALTIRGLFYQPFNLIFPSAPREFDGVDPIVVINNGNPTALRMTAGSNALVLTNNDVVQPLLVGFPWSLNQPANTIFPVKVETSQDAMLPNSIPFVNRPIAPGATDVYHLSLRFGPASATTKSLAADLYQSFATVYPFAVNWPDRRPIGQLIAASTATGFATNPRGWFNDPTVDVTTPQGIAAFQTRLLAWAQNAVVILKSMNAQGMITWDIEGEQYPQPTTYIGDPTVFSTLAPEMAAVADQYFQTFTSAGLRVGVCVRPQQLVIPTGGGAPTQTTVADPTQLLINKVQYANQRWGATLFYIDSNGDPNFPIGSSFFQKVAVQFPNVLLIPEHETTSYFGFGSWYGELRGGFTGTPSNVLDVYPSAFSVIYLPDGNFSANQTQLQSSVNRGDIMMFRAWYTDPQNQEILTLYPTNGVAPPTPSIATPVNNSSVHGTVTVAATVEPGPAGVTGVQYFVDGNPLGNSVPAPPFPETLETSALTAGLHQIQARAMDDLGDQGLATSNFFVNPTAGNPLPAIRFSWPLIGSVVSGIVPIEVQLTDTYPMSTVQFTLDGASLGPELTQAPFYIPWNSSLTGNGVHTLGVTAMDQVGGANQATETVTVENAVAALGALAGAVIPVSGLQNLTVEGAADWVHWGLSTGMAPDRKAHVTPQITGASLGLATASSYSNNPFGFTWSDGTPTALEPGTASGVYVTGLGNGFQITAPADTNGRTLTIYSGVYNAQAQMTAELSDGSAPSYTDTSVVNFNGQLSVAYVLNYQAGSPGQSLLATVTQLAGSGDPGANVTLQAAALAMP